MANLSMADILQQLNIPLNAVSFPLNLTSFEFEDFLQVTQEEQASKIWFDPTTHTLLICAFALIVLFGIFGNALVIYVICKNRKNQSSRNWFILNLAVSDIFTCILCVPFSVMRLLVKTWTFGEFMCKLVPTLQAMYVFVSTFTVLAIAIDRYKAIVFYSTRSPTKTVMCCVFPIIWAISVAMAIPMFMYHHVQSVQIHPPHANFTPGVVLYSICSEVWSSFIARGCYTVAVLVIHYACPLVVITSLHVSICKFLTNRIHSDSTAPKEIQRARRHLMRHRKTMMLLTAIAVSFAITWLPLTIVNILADLDYHIFKGINFNLLIAICIMLAMSSVCINPIVYGWLNSNFKKDLLNIVCRQRSSEDRDREQLVQEKELSHAHRRDRNDCYSSMFLHSTY